MSTKREQMLKRQRRAERLNKKQIYDAAIVAAKHGFAVCIYSIITVLKDRATNPKLEEILCEMFKVWNTLAEGKVRIETIIESIEMEKGIRYDLESGEIRNMRRKGD